MNRIKLFIIVFLCIFRQVQSTMLKFKLEFLTEKSYNVHCLFPRRLFSMIPLGTIHTRHTAHMIILFILLYYLVVVFIINRKGSSLFNSVMFCIPRPATSSKTLQALTNYLGTTSSYKFSNKSSNKSRISLDFNKLTEINF